MGERKPYVPAMLAVGAIAFVLSVILTVHSFSGLGLIGCTAGTGCDAVTHSKWSQLLGVVPVSALSALLYAGVLVCVWRLRSGKRGPAILLMALSTAALLAAVWFVALQAVKIRSFCPYCLAAHGCGLFLFLLALLYLLHQGEEGRRGLRIALPAGAVLAALLIVFQLLTTPRVRARQGSESERLPIPAVAQAPRVGAPDARWHVALLYDYQCPHCREIHGMLEEIVDHYGGALCFVLCPTPLSQACNPYILGDTDRFEGSCALTRQALGLWNIDPALFRSFDAWLFAADENGRWQPRKVEEAAQHAASLAAGRRPDEGWMEGYLRACLELFARTSRTDKSGIPRLVYGNSWVIPEAETARDLIPLIDELIQEP